MSERRTVVKNTAFLAASQFGGYLVPFLTLPYLARVLDQETFGAWQYCLTFIGLSTAAIDFGLSSYGVRLVASGSLGGDGLKRFVARTIAIKSALFLGTMAVAAAMAATVPLAARYPTFFILNAASQFYLALYPGFLFQGLERMEFPAAFNLLTQAVKLAAIFAFVRGPEDYMALAYMNVANACMLAAGGFIAMRPALKGIKPDSRAHAEPSLGMIARDSSVFYATSLSTTLVGSASAFVMGSCGGGSGMAQYSIGDKVVALSKSLYAPALSALFPFLSRKAARRDGGIQETRQLLRLPVVAAATAASLALVAFAPLIVRAIAGDGYGASIAILRILSIKFLINAVGDFLFMQYAYPLGLERGMLIIFSLGGVASVGLSALGYVVAGGLGLAWATVAAELGVHTCTAALVAAELRRRKGV